MTGAREAVQPSGALFAPEVVHLAALAFVWNDVNTGQQRSGCILKLTACVTAAKASYWITDLEVLCIFAKCNDKACILMANCHGLCRWLFGCVAPEKHLRSWRTGQVSWMARNTHGPLTDQI